MYRASALKISRAVVRIEKRGLADLTVLPTRQPIISYGPPGRSAVSGHVATVFGCTGFLGRYLVSKLAKAGTQVIIPYRDEDEKRHLKVLGDLGQIVPLEWDLRHEDQIAECMRHSDIVYNLVGRDYETKNFDYNSVHVAGAASIANIASQLQIPRLVHVSHLNASHKSESQFYRAKAEGEDAVREAFPEATIIRPGPIFGHEDKLINSMAVWPILWTLNHGDTKIRPVHVLDVAQALSNLSVITNPAQVYNLPGPAYHTYTTMLDLVAAVTCKTPAHPPTIPKPIALALARAAQVVWWPALSPDEVVRRYINDSDVPGDWDALGITPEEVEGHAITYLRRYRSAQAATAKAVIRTLVDLRKLTMLFIKSSIFDEMKSIPRQSTSLPRHFWYRNDFRWDETRDLFTRTTSLARPLYIVRNYAVSRSNPRPKDPILNSPNAKAQQIAPDVTFIHNPPSSVPTPHSLTTMPASPLLSKPTRSSGADHLPPVLHPKAEVERPKLTRDQIEEIRRLRLSDPKTNSCQVLAEKFNCTPIFVSMVAPLPKQKREELEKEQREAQKREQWGEKKNLIREIRKKRRHFW
ncbi:RmlD substrate binding domain [Rhizoctonia solani]|uniref:RmlD substrate binding domain n=2 Tax=Rhizoctonia solani TaxID=456999 RepID=A0A8H7LMF1_9AGAM|nr:RmlD substrate binding domain [Rhizoctonia solani]